MVCYLGPQTLFKIFMDKQTKEKEEEEIPAKRRKETAKDEKSNILGFDPVTGVYDSSNYEHTVLNMAKVCGQLQKGDILLALTLSKILETKTDFFKKIQHNFEEDENLKEEFMDFISESIAHHFLLQMRSASENRDISSQDEFYNVSMGAVLPTSTLICHSCDPNIFLCGRSHWKEFAYVAIRDLKSGEELCASYQDKYFGTMEKSERQSSLLNGFEFNCDCIPCLDDWPTMEEIPDEVKFCCSVCSSGLGVEMRRSENFQKIQLSSANNFTCSSCGRKHSERKLKEKLSNYKDSLDVSSKLTDQGSSLASIKSLKEAGQFFQYHLIPPSKQQIKCEELLKKAFNYSIRDEE